MNCPRFRPRMPFRDGENVYLPQLTYNASTPALIRLAEQWVIEGKAEWVTRRVANVGGRGIVTGGK